MAAWIIVYGMRALLLVSTIAIASRLDLIGAIVQGLASLPVVRRYVRPNMDWIHGLEDLLLVIPAGSSQAAPVHWCHRGARTSSADR
jgi:hypothetical protein